MGNTLQIDPNQLIATACVLVGVIIGQSSTWLLTWILEVNRRAYERKQAAAVVKAELDAIYLLISVRRYEQLLAQSVEFMSKSNEIYLPNIPIRQEIFPVYKANISKLGLLPKPIPSNLALLFTLATGVREDLQTLNETKPDADLGFMIKFQTEVLLILRCSMWLGEETILLLQGFLEGRLSRESKKRLKEAQTQKEMYWTAADQAKEQMRELRKVVKIEERRGS